jgi:hypothetical protein
MAERGRASKEQHRAVQVELMDTDSDEEPAQHEKVAVDHTRDMASKTIPAREAGIGTDVDASDHEQASEMELTSASTNTAEDIGNNRADEERDKAVRSVAEAGTPDIAS